MLSAFDTVGWFPLRECRVRNYLLTIMDVLHRYLKFCLVLVLFLNKNLGFGSE